MTADLRETQLRFPVIEDVDQRTLIATVFVNAAHQCRAALRAMDCLDAECDTITHGRYLLLDNAVNQSRVYEAPIGGTWVGLAELRKA